MAYIYLDELKEILPEILDQWIDEDDESWEWIFQEIEQKCHIGKRKKDKKKHKNKKVDEVVPKIMGDFDSRINAQTKRIDELSNKISHLSVNHTAMASRVDRVERDIKAAKSMAQTAKQRTEVDYTTCSKKEIPLVKKTCETCKYIYVGDRPPCTLCNEDRDKWEAKDNDCAQT